MHFIFFFFIYYIKSIPAPDIEEPTDIGSRSCGHSKITSTDIVAGTSSYKFCQNLQDRTFTVKTNLDNYFFYSSNVGKVVLSETVTEIGKGAFAFCPFLELQISAASTFDDIGKGAFYKSNLRLTSSQTKIFQIKNLQSHAFYSCNVDQLEVKLECSVPESAFEHCVSSSNGLKVNFVIDSTDEITRFTIGKNAFAYSSIQTFELNDYISSVEESAFQFSSLNKFSVKTDDIKQRSLTISQYAFYHCNFGSNGIVIPTTVTQIGIYAFANCVTQSVRIEGNSAGTTIGDYAFYGCSMGSLSFGDFPSKFEEHSFGKCQSITKLEFGSIQEIPPNAFQEDLITSTIDLNIPATINTIGEGAFKHCIAIKSVTFDANSRIDEISNFLFYECTNLQSITNLPNTITSIGAQNDQNHGHSFYNCINLETFSTPKYLETIFPQSFKNCKKLKSIELPSSLKTIGESAFEGCTDLNISNEIVLSYEISTIGDRIFYGCSSLSGEVKILAGSVSDEMFYGCSGITKLFIQRDITTISERAFYGCTNLIELVAAGVKTINKQAFYGCTNLVGPLPAAISTLQDEAFYGCSSLTGEIPSGLTSLPKGAFYGCSKLTGEIPKGLTTFKSYALYECRGLIGPVTITTNVAEYAFYNCKGLTSIIISITATGVTQISVGDYAFYGCSGLTSELDATKLSKVGRYAFAGCSRLRGQLNFASNVVIEDFAFQGCSGFSNSLSFDIGGTSRTKIGRNAFQDCTGFKDGTLSFVINSKEETTSDGYSTSYYYKFNYFLQICNNAFDNTKFKDIYYLGRFEPDCDYDIGISKIQGIHTSSHYANKSFCNHPLHSDDLSAGAIAGIVIACIVVVAAIAVLVVFLILRRRKNKPQSEEEYEMNQDP